MYIFVNIFIIQMCIIENELLVIRMSDYLYLRRIKISH